MQQNTLQYAAKHLAVCNQTQRGFLAKTREKGKMVQNANLNAAFRE